MSDHSDSRQKFIDVAHRLFAERGYYGVSVAAVSAEMGLTKQAVLHHFGSKEKLYGAVLEQLAGRFEAALKEAVVQGHAGGASGVLRAIHAHLMRERADARIVVRELLDNVDRAARSRKWYLRPLLDAMVEVFRSAPVWRNSSDDEVYAAMYQAVGAINYFAISGPTLEGILGEERLTEVERIFPAVLGRFVDREGSSSLD